MSIASSILGKIPADRPIIWGERLSSQLYFCCSTLDFESNPPRGRLIPAICRINKYYKWYCITLQRTKLPTAGLFRTISCLRRGSHGNLKRSMVLSKNSGVIGWGENANGVLASDFSISLDSIAGTFPQDWLLPERSTNHLWDYELLVIVSTTPGSATTHQAGAGVFAFAQ